MQPAILNLPDMYQSAAYFFAMNYGNYNFSTGYTAIFEIRESPAAPAIIVIATNADTIMLSDGTTGSNNVTVNLTPAQTANAIVNLGYYELRITPPGGQTFVALRGRITAYQSVAR